VSDRLSPILVKELRQGMRARVFEGSFILVQVLMVFAMIVALSAAARNQYDVSRVFGEGLFWAMVAIPMLLIMPIRGTVALRSEVQIGALELIFLTRLSAWRIVAGKWGALFAQTCLLLCAVLPYTVLRYYLGSVDLVRDLLIILGLMTVSGLFTAMTVSVSAFPSKLARAMVIIFPLVVINLAPAGLMAVAASPGRGVVTFSHTGSAWASLAMFAFYSGVILVYLLEIGAARIAPPAENHAILKRLLGFAVLAWGPIAILLGAGEQILVLNMVLLVPVCVDALCANPTPLPGQFRPFLKWPRLGRVASWLLIPGWPTGVLYTLLVLGLSLAGLSVWGLLDEDMMLFWVALCGALLLPVAVILVVRPKTPRMGGAYAMLQLLILIGTSLFLMLNEIFDWELENLMALCPMSTLMMALVEQTEPYWIWPSSCILGMVLVLIFVAGRSAYREHVALREAARTTGRVRPDAAAGEWETA
jgi:hypothetical protein